MVKRAIIEMTPNPKIRVSRPGVNVDTAGEFDFLLHENHLFAQPYFYRFVACPFAGDTSNNNRDSTVNVSVPNVTSDPIVILFPVSSASANIFPDIRAIASGSVESGFPMDNWLVGYTVVSATLIRIRFQKFTGSRRSPNGTYMILIRRAI